MALLARLTHEMATAPAIGELLSAVEGTDLTRDPDSDAAVNVREIRRAYDRAVKLPQRLVEELARVTSLAQQVWQEARKADDFAAFRPSLEKIVALKREEAQAVGYKSVPYDALLDEYEPGADTAEITRVFAALRQDLAPLVAGDRVFRPHGRRATFWSANIRWTASRRSAGRRRPRSASTSRPAGWTRRRTRFAAASAPATAASPRATTRASSTNRSSASCTRPATASTNRGCRPRTTARRAARRRRWESTNRNRVCGRIRSAAAGRSGTTSSPRRGRRSRRRCAT